MASENDSADDRREELVHLVLKVLSRKEERKKSKCLGGSCLWEIWCGEEDDNLELKARQAL